VPTPGDEAPAVPTPGDEAPAAPSEPAAPEAEAASPKPEPTGIDKILVETYGYEFVGGKAYAPGTAPKEVSSD
jgi:hypothetical protein